MKHFLLIGFLISCVLAFFFSPFASSFPDGLERVSKELGFFHKEIEPIIKSPIPDYSSPFIKDGRLATSFAGLMGTLFTFILAYSTGYIIKKFKKK